MISSEKNARLRNLKDSIKGYQGYKVCAPEETVECVSQGIARYTSKSFSYDEDVIGQSLLPDVGVKIGWIKFDDNSLFSGGKGRGSAYCKASSFAEFAERISTQSFRFIMPAVENYRRMKQSADSCYAPRKQVDNTVADTYFKKKEMLSTHGFEKVMDEPQLWRDAVSLTSGKDVKYPWLWHWITNFTNGIASGNTHEEAIIHGICEVIERDARFRFLSGDYQFPEIDLSTIPDKYADWIKKLNAIEIDIKVLDMTLFDVPVIGVIFTDNSFPAGNVFLEKWNKKICVVGSDTDPAIALERCFSEYYQLYTPGFISLQRFERYERLLRMWGYDDQISFPFHTNTNRMNRIPLSSVKSQKRFQNVVNLYDRNNLVELKTILKNLARHGMEVLAEDYTDPKIQFPVVRVVIPEACFIFLESFDHVICQMRAVEDLARKKYRFFDHLESPNLSIYFGQSTFLSSILSEEWKKDPEKKRRLIHALEMKLKYTLIPSQNSALPTEQLESSLALLRDLYLANGQWEQALVLTEFLLEPTYCDVNHLVRRHYILDQINQHAEAEKTMNWINRLNPSLSWKPMQEELYNGNIVNLAKYLPDKLLIKTSSPPIDLASALDKENAVRCPEISEIER